MLDWLYDFLGDDGWDKSRWFLLAAVVAMLAFGYVSRWLKLKEKEQESKDRHLRFKEGKQEDENRRLKIEEREQGN